MESLSPAIRHDARAFRESHGRYPCFTRRLVHNGEEWSFTRARNDGMRWTSHLRKSLTRERGWRQKQADEMSDVPNWHQKHCREPSARATFRRAIRTAVRCAREWRLTGQAEG